MKLPFFFPTEAQCARLTLANISKPQWILWATVTIVGYMTFLAQYKPL